MPAYIILLCCIIFCHTVSAQKKWIGNKPGGWENVLNWQPAGVPASADDVVLDNSLLESNYIIALPDVAVNIHSLLIAPSPGMHIELIVPVTNKSSPALIVTGTGNSIAIRKGGILRNSSGLNSGQSIRVNGLICIYDDGCYVHNSRSGHANDIVAKLSTAAGTSKGIFEFDVPGGSYPISFSNRTYGTLILSAIASGGTQTYNASGTNPVIVNGKFQINSGVQFNADLTKDMIVNGEYIQHGGVFNIASQANNNTVKLRGDVYQSASGVITETSGGLPTLELSGNVHQQVSIAGSILNSVALSVNNPNGISLVSPLTVLYKLVLADGTLKTTATNIITLADSCSVNGASPHSYIEGPVRKVVTGDFEFPIGKQGDYAPLKITRAAGSDTGEFIAEYFLGNPQTIYGANFENPPMVRISGLEYWLLKRLAGSSSYRLTLSVRTYSNATALDKLVTARWDTVSSSWKSEGDDAYFGIATGTITSKVLKGFGAFTLASTVPFQNPLPANRFVFKVTRTAENIELKWHMEDVSEVDHFEVQQSFDGEKYSELVRLEGKAGERYYKFTCHDPGRWLLYFRLKIITKKGDFYFSDNIALEGFESDCKIIKISPVPVRNGMNITVTNSCAEAVQLIILDLNGRRIKMITPVLKSGKNEIYLYLADLRPGEYVLQMVDSGKFLLSKRFVKL